MRETDYPYWERDGELRVREFTANSLEIRDVVADLLGECLNRENQNSHIDSVLGVRDLHFEQVVDRPGDVPELNLDLDRALLEVRLKPGRTVGDDVRVILPLPCLELLVEPSVHRVRVVSELGLGIRGPPEGGRPVHDIQNLVFGPLKLDALEYLLGVAVVHRHTVHAEGSPLLVERRPGGPEKRGGVGLPFLGNFVEARRYPNPKPTVVAEQGQVEARSALTEPFGWPPPANDFGADRVRFGIPSELSKGDTDGLRVGRARHSGSPSVRPILPLTTGDRIEHQYRAFKVPIHRMSPPLLYRDTEGVEVRPEGRARKEIPPGYAKGDAWGECSVFRHFDNQLKDRQHWLGWRRHRYMRTPSNLQRPIAEPGWVPANRYGTPSASGGSPTEKGQNPPNSLLLLWAVNSTVPLALAVADCWGFTYKTVLTWDKVRSGIGVWLKGQTEHLIVAVRGRVPPPTVTKRGTRWTTLLREVRREHSRKPDVIYDLAEDLGPPPRVELFARRRREGWDAWGDEAPSETQPLPAIEEAPA